MTDKISVVLADDHRGYVEGLTALFQNDDRIHLTVHVHAPTETVAVGLGVVEGGMLRKIMDRCPSKPRFEGQTCPGLTHRRGTS